MNNIHLFHSASGRPAPTADGTLGLSESVVLNPRGPVSFQWSDFHELCRHNQARLLTDASFQREYQLKVEELERLKAIPVWLKDPAGAIVTTNLYELYESTVLDSLQRTHGKEHGEVSFIAPSGPYKKFAVADCFNQHTYQDFVRVFLLAGKLPQRDFRLRVPCPLLMEHGRGFSGASLIELQQITTNGLLLKMPAELFLEKVRPGPLRLLMRTQGLEGALNAQDWVGWREAVAAWGAHPFYTHSKKELFELNSAAVQMASRYDHLQTRDVYLFVAYQALKESHALLAQPLERFVLAGRDHLLKGLALAA